MDVASGVPPPPRRGQGRQFREGGHLGEGTVPGKVGGRLAHLQSAPAPRPAKRRDSTGGSQQLWQKCARPAVHRHAPIYPPLPCTGRPQPLNPQGSPVSGGHGARGGRGGTAHRPVGGHAPLRAPCSPVQAPQEPRTRTRQTGFRPVLGTHLPRSLVFGLQSPGSTEVNEGPQGPARETPGSRPPAAAGDAASAPKVGGGMRQATRRALRGEGACRAGTGPSSWQDSGTHTTSSARADATPLPTAVTRGPPTWGGPPRTPRPLVSSLTSSCHRCALQTFPRRPPELSTTS